MSYDAVMDGFVAVMRRRFTVPTGIDQSHFMGDIAEALEGFTPFQLASAARWFRDNREQRAFPTIAECKRVCAGFLTDETQTAVQRHVETHEEKAAAYRIEKEREREAFRLCRCEMGRVADREGWLPALVEFATERGRLPATHEVRGIHEVAARSEAALVRCEVTDGQFERPEDASKAAGIYAALSRMRRIMLDRAHRQVFGWIEEQQANRTDYAMRDAAE